MGRPTLKVSPLCPSRLVKSPVLLSLHTFFCILLQVVVAVGEKGTNDEVLKKNNYYNYSGMVQKLDGWD